MKESAIERAFDRHVRRDLGGLSYKFAPVHAGNPDRIVLLPGLGTAEGRVMFVELKAKGGTLRPAQVLWHRRARELGTEVLVLEGSDEVRAWIASEMEKYEAASKVHKMRRRCSCGKESSPGGLAIHQKSTGHTGWVAV